MNLSRKLAAFAILAASAMASPSIYADLSALTANTTEVDPALSSQSNFATCADARANAYLDLCNRFSTEPGTVRCIAAGRGAYFAECSLALCQRFNTEDGAIRCLEAARNKTYTTEELDLCNRFTTENGAIDCLRSSGAPHNGGGGDTLIRRVRMDIALALEDIYAGRTRQAALILEDTLNLIDSSSERNERK
jgi:hypothetical protein